MIITGVYTETHSLLLQKQYAFTGMLTCQQCTLASPVPRHMVLLCMRIADS
jgi:hypothetical protein